MDSLSTPVLDSRQNDAYTSTVSSPSTIHIGFLVYTLAALRWRFYHHKLTPHIHPSNQTLQNARMGKVIIIYMLWLIPA